ncbi:hypothetical protein YC2023_065207 [Brassica napus]
MINSVFCGWFNETNQRTHFPVNHSKPPVPVKPPQITNLHISIKSNPLLNPPFSL